MPAADNSRQRVEAPLRCRRARLHDAGEFCIERRDRNAHPHQFALGHAGQDVDIPGHEVRFGHDTDRMAGAIEHLQDAPHDPVPPLDRLIGVGIGADRDGARRVACRRQFAPQLLRRVRLHVQLGFEIKPRGMAEIGMRRPREAIDAAMLAAAIGVDGPIERDIGRIITGDDFAAGIDRDLGPKRRQILDGLPAVVEGKGGLGLEPAGGICQRTPPAAALRADTAFEAEPQACLRIAERIRFRRNIGRTGIRLNRGWRPAASGCLAGHAGHRQNIAGGIEQNKNIFAFARLGSF